MKPPQGGHPPSGVQAAWPPCRCHCDHLIRECLESIRPLITRSIPDAELGRGIGHLPGCERPECARRPTGQMHQSGRSRISAIRP